MTTYAETAKFTISPEPADRDLRDALEESARGRLREWVWGEWCPPSFGLVVGRSAYRLNALSGSNNWIINPA